MVKKTTRRIGWKDSFNTVMKKHNNYSADGGKVISYATRQLRHDVLLQGFRELRNMGFKFKTVLALKNRHISALVRHWESEDLAAATIQNRLSVFRTFANWIGKHGMVEGAEKYLKNPQHATRTYIPTQPKSWGSHGINVTDKINTIREASPRFADALQLQHAFGLRSKESLLLKPHLDDKGDVLIISHGTKGGRTRYVPIETQEQRELIDHLKSYLGKTDSLVPKEKTYVQYRNQYYYTLRKHGICRTEGITAHGLRHEHLNNHYQQLTGHKSPVEGGKLHRKDKALDSLARLSVSERAGHSRESIASAYIGGKQTNVTKD